MSDRTQLLEQAVLYFIGDCAAVERALAGALAGGADLFQLRDKDTGDEQLLAAAATARALCDEAGALFLLNDRPDLVDAANADGVHVGQGDMAVSAARAAMSPGKLVGLSTHAKDEIDRATSPDYIGVGPVYETPTKPGRPAVGLDLVRHAGGRALVPFFAIGGIDPSNAAAVIAAGARRIAVVRAIADADDPEAAARLLRAAVEQATVVSGVGAT